METNLLKTLAQIAGIGGISLGVLLLLFRDIIRKNIFPKFKDEKLAYRLLRLIVMVVWSVAIVGIGAWVYTPPQPINTQNTSPDEDKQKSKGQKINYDIAPYSPKVLGSSSLTLSYRYERIGDSILIKPQVPYLDSLSKGGPIKGINYMWSPFNWKFPELSIKIVNNKDKTLLLTEAIIHVRTSKVNTEPILILENNSHGGISIINEGWGKVIDPVVSFGIVKEEACEEGFPSAEMQIVKKIQTFFESAWVDVRDYVPEELQLGRLQSEKLQLEEFINKKRVCVFGTIQYFTESNKHHEVKFKTLVLLGKPGEGAPRPPTYNYELFLEAGKSGYTKYLPLSQEIKPGEVDHFLIRVGTDRSAKFDLRISFRTAGDVELPTKTILLEIFVPRSQRKFIASIENH